MHIRRFFACLTVTAALLYCAALTASASGSAVYQIAFSYNCNNPSVPMCAPPPVGSGLGGDWGSVRLNSDGTGTAEFTTATHQTPGIPTGATHLSLVVQWTLVSSATPPAGAVAQDPNGKYLVIVVVNIADFGSLITPATPGHYKFQGARLGMPGVNFMVQINAI